MTSYSVWVLMRENLPWELIGSGCDMSTVVHLVEMKLYTDAIGVKISKEG